MELLTAVKKQLNIDADLTDDDAYLTQLIAAGKAYMLGAGVPEGEGPLHQLCLTMIVADWYERRESVEVGRATTKELPRHVSDILLQLRLGV